MKSGDNFFENYTQSTLKARDMETLESGFKHVTRRGYTRRVTGQALPEARHYAYSEFLALLLPMAQPEVM